MKRGQIYYIHGQGCLGERDIKPARPGIIVTPDHLIDMVPRVQVVFLTTSPQYDLPCHAVINATGQPSTALCEQIAWVDKTRIGDFCGMLSTSEQERLDVALMVSLGLDLNTCSSPAEPAQHDTTAELLTLRGERDAYKAMVEKFILGVTK